MDTLSLILLIVILFLLVTGLIYLLFYLPKKQKETSQQQKETSQQQIDNYLSKLASFNEQQEKLLKTHLEQLEKELKNSKEALSGQQKEINEQQEKLLKARLDALGNQQKEETKKQEELLKLRLDALGQELKNSKEALSKINSLLLAPFERGRLGNIQLDRLLSLYLPKDDKIYQLEYTLSKKTERGEGLRPDAVVFGVDQKSNLAIDSKFPLDNYLSSVKDDISKQEKEERIKKFKENLKVHIKKVAEYISKEDDIRHVIMFVPSEVIFAKINEESYYEIFEFALAKKVSLCSPVTLSITVNQILVTNTILEQYRTMDKVLNELKTFWDNFARWKDRWAKILKDLEKFNKDIRELNTSVEKITKHGENIKKIKAIPQLEKGTSLSAIPSEKEEEN